MKKFTQVLINTLIANVTTSFLWFALTFWAYLETKFAFPYEQIANLMSPVFWAFAGIMLAGSVVESMRNIALSTTVTILVPKEKHANANGLVGSVAGIGFLVTSVFSGLAIGFLGMGWTIFIAIAFIFLAAGLIMLIITLLAFATKSYRILSKFYAKCDMNSSRI